MQSVSATYKALLEAGAQREVKAVISGETYGENKLISVNTKAALFDSTVSVGNCIAMTADIVLWNPGTIPRMAKIELYVRLTGNMQVLAYSDPSEFIFGFVPSGTESITLMVYKAATIKDQKIVLSDGENITVTVGEQTGFELLRGKYCVNGATHYTVFIPSDAEFSWMSYPNGNAIFATQQRMSIENITASEWIPKGVYYIDEREYDKESDILTLSCYDAMLKTEQAFCTPGEQGNWPRTDIVMVDEICERIGVSLDSRTRAILTNSFLVQYPGIVLEDGTPQYDVDGALSMREILGYIGSMYAGNWIMNDAGELRLVALGDIPKETNLLVEEHGYYITLGGVRILV